MSAKASPKKKKVTRSTTRSTDRTALATAPTADDASVESAAAAAEVAEHAVPAIAPPSVAEAAPMAEPIPASAAVAELPTDVLPSDVPPAGSEPSDVIAAEPRPAAPAEPTQPDVAAVAELAELSLEQPAVPADPQAVPAVQTSALDLPSSEASSTQAMQAIRRALPSREQAVAALRLFSLRQSLLSAVDLLLPSQGVILDVGCGAGLVTAYLAQTAPGRVLIGIDNQPTQIQRAERLARDLGLAQNRYLLGDVQTVELPTGVAAIYAIDALSHLPLSAHEEVLARLASLLQPGGMLIIKERTTESLLGTRVAELIDWTVHQTLTRVLGEPQTAGSDASYRHHEDWLALLRRQGLRARAGLVPDLFQPHVLLTATRL